MNENRDTQETYTLPKPTKRGTIANIALLAAVAAIGPGGAVVVLMDNHNRTDTVERETKQFEKGLLRDYGKLETRVDRLRSNVDTLRDKVAVLPPHQIDVNSARIMVLEHSCDEVKDRLRYLERKNK